MKKQFLYSRNMINNSHQETRDYYVRKVSLVKRKANPFLRWELPLTFSCRRSLVSRSLVKCQVAM